MRKRVMIVMVLSALDGRRSLGGVDSACQAQLQGLAEISGEGEDYIVVAFNPANDLGPDESETAITPNIKLLRYNYIRRDEGLRRLPNVVRNELLVRHLIRAFRPDVVHSHLPQWHIRKWGSEKKILTLHQYHTIGRTPVSQLNDLLHRDIIEPASIRNADAVTCVSHDVIDALNGRAKVAVRYIPNAINQRYFGLPRSVDRDGCIQLLMAGTVARAKRVMDALEVIRRLKADHPAIRLTLAGKPSADEAFNRQVGAFIAAHSLGDNVRLAGVLSADEMLRQMQNTHIGLFLSEQETFGLAGLECLAAGIPLVTTRVGVFKWQEQDFASRGVDVVGVGDIGAATEAISRRIASATYDLNGGMGDYLIGNFSRRSCAAQYRQMYEMVCPSPERRALPASRRQHAEARVE